VGVSGRVLAWAGGAVAVVAAAGLGVYLWVAGLSKASELASVVVGFAALIGAGIAWYGVVQAHKDALAADKDAVKAAPEGADDGQSVANSTAGTVTQVKGVTGSVRIGGSSQSASPSSPAPPTGRSSDTPPPAAPRTAPGGQTVVDSDVSGDVSQVDGVGGDVDIDR
jgi:hypothetical protein